MFVHLSDCSLWLCDVVAVLMGFAAAGGDETDVVADVDNPLMPLSRAQLNFKPQFCFFVLVSRLAAAGGGVLLVSFCSQHLQHFDGFDVVVTEDFLR